MSPPRHISHSLLLQVYRSTRRQNLRNIPLLQVTMSPPHHICYSPPLPNTGLQVNTSSKLPETYQHHRSPCHHFPINLNLYYYLLHFYRSTCRQSPKNHTLLQVTMSPPCHIFIIYYYQLHVYRSTRRQNSQNHTVTTGHHVTIFNYLLYSANITTNYMSTCQHVVKTLRFLRLPQVTMSPPCQISYSLLLPTTCLQVNMSSKP